MMHGIKQSFKPIKCVQDSAPKHNIPIERINVTLEVAVDKNNAMHIMARMDGQTRNIFVYAESGTVSIIVTHVHQCL